MYRLFVEEQLPNRNRRILRDLGEIVSVAQAKKRLANYSKNSVLATGYAEIRFGSGCGIYAYTEDGITWTRIVSPAEKQRNAMNKMVKLCRKEIFSSPYTIEAHKKLRQKYGDEIFEKAFT